MKRSVKSKMSEDFEKKRGLRSRSYNDTNDAGDTGADAFAEGGMVCPHGKQGHCPTCGYADGGPIAPSDPRALMAKTQVGQTLQNRGQVIENAVAPQPVQPNITPPMPSSVPATTAPVDPLTAQLEAKARLRAQTPVAPPKKGLFGLGILGLADGGSPWQQDYRAGGALSRLAAPQPAMAAAPTGAPAPQVPVAPNSVSPAPVPAASPLHSMASFNIHFDSAQAPTVGEDMANQWNNGVVGQKTGPGGYPVGLRAGGKVTGPGGPTDDKVPAMLSAGEYVLPADTVQAVGKENLDELRARTHTPVAAKGLRHMAGGGFIVDGEGNVRPANPEVKLPVPYQATPPVSQPPVAEPFPEVGDYSVRELPAQENLSRTQQTLRSARSTLGAAGNTAAGVAGRVGSIAGKTLAPAGVAFGLYNTATENPASVQAFNQSVGAPEGGVIPTIARGLRNIGNASTFGGAGYLGRGLANLAGGSPWSTPAADEVSATPGTPTKPAPVQATPLRAPQLDAMGSAPETQVGTTPIPPALNPGITKAISGTTGNPIYSGSNIQDTSDASANAAAQGWANIRSEQARFAAKDAQDAQERAASQDASAARASAQDIDKHYDALAMRAISSLKDNPHQQVALNNQLAALEAARNAAHRNIASDVTTRRGQDIGLQEAGLRAGLEGKRIGIEGQRANQEGAFQQGELGLRGQQLKLAQMQYGNTLEEQGLKQFNDFADNQYGKGKEEDNAGFKAFVSSGNATDSKGRPWSMVSPQERMSHANEFKLSYEMAKAANEEGGANLFGGGKETNAPFIATGIRPLTLSELNNNVAVSSFVKAKLNSALPVENKELFNQVVTMKDGRSVILGKLVATSDGKGIDLQKLKYIRDQIKANGGG